MPRPAPRWLRSASGHLVPQIRIAALAEFVDGEDDTDDDTQSEKKFHETHPTVIAESRPGGSEVTLAQALPSASRGGGTIQAEGRDSGIDRS